MIIVMIITCWLAMELLQMKDFRNLPDTPYTEEELDDIVSKVLGMIFLYPSVLDIENITVANCDGLLDDDGDCCGQV